jgi:putative transposase
VAKEFVAVLGHRRRARRRRPGDQLERLNDFDVLCGDAYPAIRRLWDSAWSEFGPFLDYAVEIRRVIYSTNATESLNARIPP